MNLSIQRRLAADILGCGQRKVFFYPEQVKELSRLHTREQLRAAIKVGYVARKADNTVSRFNTRKVHAEKAKGRHTGIGKRIGGREARMPTKILWTRRQRILRRVLSRFRDAGKIDKHMHSELYAMAKGNTFKNKRVLIEYIWQEREKVARQKAAEAMMMAKKEKAQALRAKRVARIESKRAAIAEGTFKQ